MNNPQGNFENSIFGPHGTHPTPKTLPYPTQKINTIYGETVEYLIPDDRREEVLKELYPFGTPPSLDDVLMDIHLDKEFAVRDFKVIEQNGYVMLVSPYFAVDGASVVDWQPKNAAEDGTFISKMAVEQIEKAFSAGRADGFTGMPKGTAKPTRAEGMSTERFRAIESVYDEGYEVGRAEREQQQNPSFFTSNASRRTGRRPR